MILGRRYSRFKKSVKYRVRPFYVMEDGTEFRPHRKLGMMLTLLPLGGINQKAMDKESEKILARMAMETSKRQMAEMIARNV